MAITERLEQYMTAVAEYRRVETEIYRSRFGKKFITTTEERRRLLEADLPLGERIKMLSPLSNLKLSSDG